MSQISDQELIKGYLNGNEQALAVLLDRYIKPLHTFVYHLVGGNSEADDVVQETCVKLWRSLKKYDSQKNFKTWIFQIAKNTAIDYLRKKRPLRYEDLTMEDGETLFGETIADPRPSILEVLERRNAIQFLQSVIEKLPVAQQLVLDLYYREQLNFREIAEILSESLHTVKSRHYRALQSLKELLEAEPKLYAPKSPDGT